MKYVNKRKYYKYILLINFKIVSSLNSLSIILYQYIYELEKCT